MLRKPRYPTCSGHLPKRPPTASPIVQGSAKLFVTREIPPREVGLLLAQLLRCQPLLLTIMMLSDIRNQVYPLSLTYGLSFADLLHTEQRVLRNLRRLHKMLRGQMFGADPKTLAFYVIDTAQGLAIVIDQLRMQPLPSKRIKADEIVDNYQASLAITATARSFTTLLHAIKRISEYSESDQLFGNIVYYCYKLFDSIITTIEEAANSEAKSQLTAELTKKQPTKPKRAEKNTASVFHPLIPALTSLIRAMVDKFDTEMPRHNQILEGLIFAIIQRLGEVEHFFAFSGPRIEDMEEAIRTLPPGDEKRLDPAHRMTRRAMVIEAPYLLDILKKTIQSLPATSRRNAPENAPLKQTLTPQALARLQRTLVDCIFGPGTRGDQASTDFIKQPVLSGPALILQKTPGSQKNDKEEIMAEWFEEELWVLIGWEILGRDEHLSSL